ncbi:hypothetical protein INR49_031091 [Caranx melampygus]|nr:hypothetical protein INR49_031091 [Caranx melampygus]
MGSARCTTPLPHTPFLETQTLILSTGWKGARGLALLEISFNCLEEVESTSHSLDVRDIEGRTALHLAARRGFTSCVEVLLKHQASYTLKEHRHKWTALHAAAAEGQMDCLLLLVNGNKVPTTALMLAALGRHTDCVHILLEKGANADAADKRASQLYTELEDCVSALLEHGASALCRDSQGRTPLHLAASCGHTELLRCLLKAAIKADPLDSMLDHRGYTPTHWAAYHGHEGCLHILLENKLFSTQEGNQFTPLHCALVNGHEVAAERLVKTVGPQIVKLSDAKGRTALHAAAYSGNVAGLQLVLDQGAEVNAVDHSDCSALMVAADCGQTAAVGLFTSQRGEAWPPWCRESPGGGGGTGGTTTTSHFSPILKNCGLASSGNLCHA